MRPVNNRIMYIERTDPGGQTQWARIGRVACSKTGRTLYYDGRSLKGMGRAWYRDESSGEMLWIQTARCDGRDRGGKHKRGSFEVVLDEDVRQEYWSEIRHQPNRSHERVVRS